MAITASASGGTRNWSDTASWVGGVVPSASSDVLLTVTSGNIIIDGTSGSPSLCRSLVCTGYTATLTQGSGAQLNIGDSSVGAFTLVSGMTYAPNVASLIKFVSTTGTNNITTAGKLMGALTFDGVGGSWQLQDSLTGASSPAANVLTLANGALDINGKTVSIGSFDGGGTNNTRSITLGASSFTVNQGAGWDVRSISTGLTVSPGTSTIANTSPGGQFRGGGLTYNNYSFSGNAGTMVGINTFANLTINTINDPAAAMKFSDSQTITSALTINGNNATARCFVSSNTIGTRITLTAGSISASNVDFRDVVGAGAATWDLHAITGLSGDCGNNSGITFTSPINCYWVNNTGNWATASQWKTTTGGGVTAHVPLPQDTAIFDANSFTTSGRVVTISLAPTRISSIDFTGATNTPKLTISENIICFGNITFISSMTMSGTVTVTLGNPGVAQSLTTAGVNLTTNLTVDTGIGTTTFQDNYSSSKGITITSGALTSAAGKTISPSDIILSGGTLTPSGNIILSATFSQSAGTLNSSLYSISGGTTANFSGGIANILSWSGSTVIFNNTMTIGAITATGAVSINGGTLSVGSGGVSTTKISFGAGSTSTVNMGSGTWTLSGTGNVWNATVPGSLIINAQTSTIAITDTSASTKTFASAGLTYNNLTVSGAVSNGTLTISGAATFNIITFAADCSIIWTKTTTYTFTSLVCNGSSGHVVTFATNTAASPATLSCPNTVSVDWMSIKDSTAAGNTPFYAGANSISVSGNTNWIFGVPHSATITAHASLSATGQAQHTGVATLTAHASLSAVTGSAANVATFFAHAALSAAGTGIHSGVATLSSHAALSVIGQSIARAVATISPHSVLSSIGASRFNSALVIAAIVQLNAIGRSLYSSQASIAAHGVLSAGGNAKFSTSASLSASVDAAFQGATNFSVVAIFSPRASLSAIGQSTTRGIATFSPHAVYSPIGAAKAISVATISSNAIVNFPGTGFAFRAVHFDAEAALNAIGRSTAKSVAILVANTELDATGIAFKFSVGTFSPRAVLNAVGYRFSPTPPNRIFFPAEVDRVLTANKISGPFAGPYNDFIL